MKRIVAVIATVALVAALAPAGAAAGDREWATAGKILTGIIGVSILGHALANSYPYPAAVYAPAPRVYYEPPREQVWVPGHYETRLERRWIPGHWEVRRHGRDDYYDDDDRYETRRVWIPGHHETSEVRVWVPGHWEDRG